jgi:hypothetical protein
MNGLIRHRWMTFLALVPATAILAAACSSKESQTGQGGSSGNGASSSGSGNASSSGSGDASSSGSSGSSGQGGGAGACAGALFCDDFEAQTPQTVPSGKWSANQVKGSVIVDTSKSFSGKQSIKVSTEATDGYKSAVIGLSDPQVFAMTDNVFYGRMMFYLESAPTTAMHWTFIDASGKVPAQGYTAIYRYGGQLPVTEDGTPTGKFLGSQLMANYETPDHYSDPTKGPSTDCYKHADRKIVPVGKWTCAEWRFDGKSNDMRFWLNGAELSDLEVVSKGDGCVDQPADYTWTAPTFDRIDVGWESYQLDQARSMWIDDVAISKQQIGCPPTP